MDLQPSGSALYYVQHGTMGLINDYIADFFDLFVEKEWDNIADWVIESLAKKG